jgi:hypothetical protein
MKCTSEVLCVGYNIKSALRTNTENLKLVMSLFSVIDVNVINEQMSKQTILMRF